MKKSMILELVAGERCFMDGISVSDNAEYKKYLTEVHDMLETFCKGMTEEERDETLWKFEAAQGGLEAITADEYFKQGFKLGLTLAAQNFLD